MTFLDIVTDDYQTIIIDKKMRASEESLSLQSQGQRTWRGEHDRAAKLPALAALPASAFCNDGQIAV
jgi:hypothetical protein